MSPLVVEKIKKANGNVRIVALTEGSTKYAVQVLDGTAWVNVYTNDDRQLCEQTVRKASNKVILG